MDCRHLHIAKISLASHSMLLKKTCCGGGSSRLAGKPQQQYLRTQSTITFQFICFHLTAALRSCTDQRVLVESNKFCLQLPHLSILYICFMACVILNSKNDQFSWENAHSTVLYAWTQAWAKMAPVWPRLSAHTPLASGNHTGNADLILTGPTCLYCQVLAGPV